MKLAIVAYAAITISTLALGSDELPYKSYGHFSSCSSTDEEQLNEAQEDLNRDASRQCAPSMVPVQLSKTDFTESHSCVRYNRGQFAISDVHCQSIETAIFSQAVFLRLSNNELRNPSPSTYQIALEHIRKVAKPICGEYQIISVSPLVIHAIEVNTTAFGEPLGKVIGAEGQFRCQN